MRCRMLLSTDARVLLLKTTSLWPASLVPVSPLGVVGWLICLRFSWDHNPGFSGSCGLIRDWTGAVVTLSSTGCQSEGLTHSCASAMTKEHAHASLREDERHRAWHSVPCLRPGASSSKETVRPRQTQSHEPWAVSGVRADCVRPLFWGDLLMQHHSVVDSWCTYNWSIAICLIYFKKFLVLLRSLCVLVGWKAW